MRSRTLSNKTALFAFLLFFAADRSSFAHLQNSTSLMGEEQKFAEMLNRFRSYLGLHPLAFNLALQTAAESHSQWMSSLELLQHNGPTPKVTFSDRLITAGFSNFTFAAENIACGNSSAAEVFKQWVFSPLHLANMVSPHYFYMGIARAGNDQQNCPYYWTNDFGSTSDGNLDPVPQFNSAQIMQAMKMVLP